MGSSFIWLFGDGSSMDFKFILSDLDGVIRTYPDERVHLIEQKYGLKPGAIFSAAFEKKLLSKAVCGIMTDEEWRLETARSLSTVYGEEIAYEATHEWSNFSGNIDRCYLEYIESRFPGVPIAVLTNGTSRLNRDLAELNVESGFFRIFNSAEIGVCKPDKRIYEHVINQLKCNPEEILFVDDSLSHILAASDLGMITCHYTSLEEFQQKCTLRGY